MLNVSDDQRAMDELIRLWPDIEVLRVKGQIIEDEEHPWALSMHVMTSEGYRVLIGVGRDQSSALRDLVERAKRIARGEPPTTDEDAPF